MPARRVVLMDRINDDDPGVGAVEVTNSSTSNTDLAHSFYGIFFDENV